MPKQLPLRTPLHTVALAALLASAAPALAQEPYAGCSVPEAEAEECPSFTLAPPDIHWVALSDDGSTIVGNAVDDTLPGDWPFAPVRWVDGVSERLLPGEQGSAVAASDGGSVVVGHSNSMGPFRWQDGVAEALASPVEDCFPPGVNAVSADGVVSVGYLMCPAEGDVTIAGALAWDADGVRILSEGHSYATDVSADGSVISGAAEHLPVLWRGESPTALPLPDGFSSGQVTAINSDASVAVGSLYYGQVVRWEDGAVELLPLEHASGSFDSALPTDVSADGDAVIGIGNSHPRSIAAFVWHAGSGAQRLDDLLSIDLGVDLLGMEQLEVRFNSMADDGRKVVGVARPEPGGHPEFTFLANVSPPVGIDIEPGSAPNTIDLARQRFITVRVYGSERLDVRDIDVSALAFGPAGAPVARELRTSDANRDGYPDREFRFETGATGIAAGDSEACLGGRAIGLPFEVCGPVQATLYGCGRGAELALLLPAAVWWRRHRRMRRSVRN